MTITTRELNDLILHADDQSDDSIAGSRWRSVAQYLRELEELRAKLAKSEAMYWRFRQIAESANQRLKLQCGEAAQRANDTEAEILNALHQFSSANHQS